MLKLPGVQKVIWDQILVASCSLWAANGRANLQPQVASGGFHFQWLKAYRG